MELKKAKETELLEELSRRGYISTRDRDIKQDLIYPIEIGQRERVGVVSDTHLGSMYQQLSHLIRFYRLCKRLKITKVFHAGDLIEGNGKLYRGQLYEMFLHGAGPQRDYVINHYPKIPGITTYFIGGSHDYSFYKETGYDVLEDIARQRPDMKYLGMFGAYLKQKNIIIYLMHGSGGNAYARSYKMQKIIEQFAPEKKPHILLLGHYHVPCHLSGYRNVEGFQLPCFQAQTPYLKAKGLYPFIGGEIVEWTHNKKGTTSFRYETIPFYVVDQGDF
ncbi:MAG: metallophosphoesterase family protein [Candidatus Auribacterota bacterium]|nr:metallophosphoesterase family protein [Candidatus Auribacterota bacterium]